MEVNFEYVIGYSLELTFVTAEHVHDCTAGGLTGQPILLAFWIKK